MEIALAPNVAIDLRGHYAHSRNDFDDIAGDNPAWDHNREFLGTVGLMVGLLGGRWRNRVDYAHTNSAREHFDPRHPRQQTFDASSRNQRFEYQDSLNLSQQLQLLFGAEHEKSRFKSVSPPASLLTPVPEAAQGETYLTSIYGQVKVKLHPVAGLALEGGVRHDHHDRFGGQTLFAAGAVRALPTGTVLRASHGEGFKAPTLYQPYTEYGNQDLAPERAHGWEVGISQSLFDDRLMLGGSWFQRHTSNQIIFSSCAATPGIPACFQPGTAIPRIGFYANVARARARSLEFSTLLQLDALRIDGNFSWTMAEDHSAGSIARHLQRGDLQAARRAVALIVGRDTAHLDEAGIARAAIESLAESFCDAVIAPLFWLLLGGLPAIWAYNTADSLIGYRNSRWRHFGWASARIDDVANFVPARIAAVLIYLAGGGWTEAAMTGALGLSLGGPMAYGGVPDHKP